MKKPVFINKDPEAIKEVLQNIGKVRFEKTLENMQKEKPRQLKNYKLTWNGKKGELSYKFPEDTFHNKLMLLNTSELPKKEWEIEFLKY